MKQKSEHDNHLFPEREIRALYGSNFIRVYQAYSDKIADSALQHQTFAPPEFKTSRMTWIKPSFLWMMYRAGWGLKELSQKRILAIDLSIDGFIWALENSVPTDYRSSDESFEDWKRNSIACPVRVQWDPERDISLRKLQHRTIQIGLSGEAVRRYTNDWIIRITDVTDLATEVNKLVERKLQSKAVELLPTEKRFHVNPLLEKKLGIKADKC